VCPHRARGNDQLACDLDLRATASDQAKHLQLAGRIRAWVPPSLHHPVDARRPPGCQADRDTAMAARVSSRSPDQGSAPG
jgi:hypothetical protein